MINIFLSRAEALLIVELLNKANESLVQSLIIGVEEENDKDTLAKAAKAPGKLGQRARLAKTLRGFD